MIAYAAFPREGLRPLDPPLTLLSKQTITAFLWPSVVSWIKRDLLCKLAGFLALMAEHHLRALVGS